MAIYEWSEIFTSIEGEGPKSGWPTVYIRFARCNFKCKGFNNPTNDVQPDGYASLGFNPKDYKTIHEIPLVTKGCDSQYSVSPEFSHMWGKGDEKALATEVLKVLPHGTFQNPVTGKRVILSLTGGEPTIRLKFWVPILEELYQHGMRTVLVETNCAAPLRDKDLEALYKWAGRKSLDAFNKKEGPVKIIWSNSPKISSSGETWADAIRPEIALKQIKAQEVLEQPWPGLVNEQYFKFVCGPRKEDFAEVAKAMEEYYQAGVPRNTDVYVMPVSCVLSQQQEIAAKVAQMCIQHGYIYCHRVHLDVFGNAVGT